MTPSMVPSNASRKEWSLAVCLMGLTLITRYAFLCRGGMGEPDSVVMAAGMAQWMSSHGSFGEAFLYGRQMNPGVYFIFRFLYPVFFHDPSHVIGFLNWFNLLCASLLSAVLYFVARKLFDRWVASACCLIVLFSPLVWEVGTYFHPVVAAALLLFLSYLAWCRISRTLAGIVFYVLACILFAAAMIVRIEVVFVVPAVIVGALVSRKGSVRKALLFGILLVAEIAYAAVLRTVSHQATMAHSGFSQYAWARIEGYFVSMTPAAIARTSIWASFGIGVATSFLGLCAIVSMLIRRARAPMTLPGGRHAPADGRALLVALIWILPSLVFWLPVPGPIVSHYFFVTLGAGWLIGEGFLRGTSPWRGASLTAAVIALNLLVPEIGYGFYNAHYPGSSKYPNGSFFLGHRAIERQISTYADLQSKFLAALRDKEHPRGVFVAGNWETYGYVNYAMAQAGRFERPPGFAFDRGVTTRTYWIEGREVRLALVTWYTNNPAIELLFGSVRQAESDDFLIFLPTELARSEVSQKLPASFIPY